MCQPGRRAVGSVVGVFKLKFQTLVRGYAFRIETRVTWFVTVFMAVVSFVVLLPAFEWSTLRSFRSHGIRTN